MSCKHCHVASGEHAPWCNITRTYAEQRLGEQIRRMEMRLTAYIANFPECSLTDFTYDPKHKVITANISRKLTAEELVSVEFGYFVLGSTQGLMLVLQEDTP